MPSAPQWLLQSFTSHSHIEQVLETLRLRESKRVAARMQSNSNGKSSTSTAKRVLEQLWPLNNLDLNTKQLYSIAIGTRPENIVCNRYCDVEPYDATRVVISDGQVCLDPPGSCSDYYLNASWVREKAGGQWWIASQAALPNTAYDFLSVMLQPRVQLPDGSFTSHIRTVVQLTQALEHGRRKADVYFPDQVGQSMIVNSPSALGDSAPPLKVTLQQQKHTQEDFVVSTVAITPLHSSTAVEPTVFTHLLYPSWPDHGVPDHEDRDMFLSFVHLVEQTNRATPPSSPSEPYPPMLVGCSAGIGRTGAYIALSSLLRSFGFLSSSSTSPPPPLPDSPLGVLPLTLRDDLVAQEIDSLREQRPGMVQREEQTIFIYEMLLAAFDNGKIGSAT